MLGTPLTRALATAALIGALAAALAGCGGAGRRAAATTAASTPSSSAGPAFAPARPVTGRRIGARRRGGPNFIFILTDDLAWNLVRYMPHVRAMRQGGLTFANYFVTDSLCCPSRTSIFTGRLPHDTRVYSNNWPDGGFGVFHLRGEERQSFALALHQAGYRTALMGKYLNGYDPATSYAGRIPPGWDEWDVAGNGYPEFGYTLNQDGRLVRRGHRPRDYLTDVLRARGLRFIAGAARGSRPFFLEIATFAPHAPFVPAPRDAHRFPGVGAPRDPAFGAANTAPPSWLRGYAPLSPGQVRTIDRDFRRRVQSVQAVDRMIGALESQLRRRGLARDTYLVFSSDNGLHMGEHRLMPGKLTAFDTDIRVPLIVVGPGVPRGSKVAAITQNTDLAPTFLRLAGQRTPLWMEGHSLAAFLRGRRVRGWRRAALVEHRGPQTTSGDPDVPIRGAGNPTSYEAVRSARFLYVRYSDRESELYDLRSDPWELHNLARRASAAGSRALATVVTALAACHDAAGCWRGAGGGR